MLETSNLTQWIINQGISQMVLEIMISMCIVATVVSIARYIFGNKTYGIYAPIVLAIAYSYTGLRYGLAITLMVILTSLLSYSVLKKIRMHYITRIATNYIILSIVLVFFFILINNFSLGLDNMSNIPPLAFISIAALSDFFIKQYIQKSLKTSVMTLLGTIVVAIVGWFVITRDIISSFVLNNLWIVPLLAVFNVLLGMFKGLRVKDYFRFRLTAKEENDK
ncbi:MAG TPA: 7TM domain-containing protein [Candidatus Dojkabacteria bacterium]|nr:7TM domain-containing protein [Candidatus Dojkabacteria bacterium]